MPTFSSDNVRIAFIDESPSGESAEPVLLIHGFASSVRYNWRETGWVAFLLRNGLRVIAMDNRGHGESEKLYDPKGYGVALMAGDARRLLDHLGIARAHVMGYSMGARVCAWLAMADPERVRSAVFAGLAGNMVRPVAGTGPIAHALEAENIDAVTNPTARTFRAFADRTGSDLKALAACIRGAREPITREMVAAIACPVLVVAGGGDVIAGPAADLARLIPGAQAITVPRRDHMHTVGDRVYMDGVLAFLKAQA
ncbi:MAG: alpha/beta hydrolase [Hyphomicrobiaceae bacterium]|nr:alpha/beta hydrolase [Hyphomicrobiaceae bacterium]